ncbi:MAG: SMI1/KNR4 family protein [Blautia sp.]|nr:SMI1/KNR4 family protein [Blautia sp.]
MKQSQTTSRAGGIDSGDNYYCVNNENGKVYYWSSSEDSYYYIAESIDEFASFFR